MFDQILERIKPNLEPSRLNIKDVNGNTITAYGQSIMNLNFNGKQFPQTIIVCDISPDDIIGQDFLLHYVNKIDYQRMVLQTSLTDIQCWVAGETQMVCRVEVKEETTIPANSRMFIPVDIPFCEKLSESCMIEPSVRLFDEKNMAILPAILQSSTENKVVSLHNFNDTDVKIYPKMKLGDCESYYEKSSTAVCCTEVSLDENPGESNLPEYLKELWERSCMHLNENESIEFANLLKLYKNVFSKSSDDIGRTNLIQHEINTGNAVPVRQPPRRLPFGKRQIEKDEIKRMLKLGVIEPSTSSWSSPVVLIAKKGGQGGTRFFVHRPGLKHRNADALSRNPCASCSRQESVNNAHDSCDEDSEEKEQLSVRTVTRSKADTSPTRNQFVLLGWDVNTIRQQQLQDKTIGQLFIKFEDKETKPDWNSLSDESSDLKTLWNMWDRFEICNGVLYVNWIDNLEQIHWRLIVFLNGQMLMEFQIKKAATVAKIFVNEFVCKFGTPLQIHTDQGANFESKIFKQMCELLCIDKTRSTSFHPQSNGCVERFNRTLTNMLSMYCAKDQAVWDEYLPQVLLAYRTSVHSTTGFTPNFLTFGREVTLPLQAVIPMPSQPKIMLHAKKTLL
ncbi:unnamed protein product [Mytilus edulis]|uniref:Integrase catalytic domain-containing protein n=1 Tax=Mytilus edulis TaxID=6550 RepID=A0A8S3THH3_MYTED|nr:unnamed protein product [Mytilus edulis]